MTVVLYRLWLLGTAIFISSNVVGSLVQIASLPVVILAPLGAVSLLWNAFFARVILGDVFSPWMILGTILIAGGAVLIAVFGIVPEPTRSLEDLLRLFNRPAFVVYFSVLGFFVILCLAVVRTHNLIVNQGDNLADLLLSRHTLPNFPWPEDLLISGSTYHPHLAMNHFTDFHHYP
jgi:magnesium transporter